LYDAGALHRGAEQLFGDPTEDIKKLAAWVGLCRPVAPVSFLGVPKVAAKAAQVASAAAKHHSAPRGHTRGSSHFRTDS
jgi:hypothetical protein